MEDVSFLTYIATCIAGCFAGYVIGVYEKSKSELRESQFKEVADRFKALADRKEARDLAYEAERARLLKEFEKAFFEYTKASSDTNGGAA